MKKFTCFHCKEVFTKNVRIKEGSTRPQKYCSAAECQRARKKKWESERKNKDPVFKQKRENRFRTKEHKRKRSIYMRAYRDKNPDYVASNKEARKKRYEKRKKNVSELDAISSLISDNKVSKNNLSESEYFVFFPLMQEDLSKIVTPDALIAEQIDIEYFKYRIPTVCKKL